LLDVDSHGAAQTECSNGKVPGVGEIEFEGGLHRRLTRLDRKAGLAAGAGAEGDPLRRDACVAPQQLAEPTLRRDVAGPEMVEAKPRGLSFLSLGEGAPEGPIKHRRDRRGDAPEVHVVTFEARHDRAGSPLEGRINRRTRCCLFGRVEF
jgi:hypothetical protein